MEHDETLLARLARQRDLTSGGNKLALYLGNKFPPVANYSGLYARTR
jgi:hypothetical protein